MKPRMVTRNQLIKMMDGNEKFKLVDVLSEEHFNNEHIKGAISLPVGEIARSAATILPDKGEKIVTYCASFDCQASTNAAVALMESGYTNVLDYKGGIKDYKESGRPLEGGLYKKEATPRSPA